MKFVFLNESKGIISKKNADAHEEYDVQAIVLDMVQIRSARDYMKFLEAAPYSFFSKMFFKLEGDQEDVIDFLPYREPHAYKGDLARVIQKECLDIDYLDGFLIREGVLGPVSIATLSTEGVEPKSFEVFKPTGEFKFIYMQSIETFVNNVQQLCFLAAIALKGKSADGALDRDSVWGHPEYHIVRSGLSIESSFNSDYESNAPIPMLFDSMEIDQIASSIKRSGYSIYREGLSYKGDLENKAFLVREEMSDAEVAAFIFTWFMNSLFEGSSEAYYSGNTFKVGFDGKGFKVFRQRSPYRELYLQVARFAELGQTKLCAHCGRAFIDMKSRGNEALYCSRSCNTKASNKRRDLARQYKAAGVPVERAIKEIGEKYTESIRGWYK